MNHHPLARAGAALASRRSPSSRVAASRVRLLGVCVPIAPVVLALSSVLLAGCVGVTQQLGDEEAVDASSPPAPTQIDVACPAARPSAAEGCAMVAAETCPYFDPSTGCTTTCLCAVDRRWACFDVSCGVLLGEACAEGAACSAATRCVAPAGAGAQRDCTCVEGSLRCTTQSSLR